MRVHVYPILITSLGLLAGFAFYELTRITKTSHTILQIIHALIDKTTIIQEQYNHLIENYKITSFEEQIKRIPTHAIT